MNEYLILRLASHSDQPIPWLVWSKQESEVIASGEIASFDGLAELKEKAAQRQVIALVPSVDCAIRQLPLPKKSRRQAITALPFMLEDELAQDIDAIHLSCYLQGQATGDVVYVSHQKMAFWLEQLASAEIKASKLVPEALALPEPQENQWAFAQLDSGWLIRQSQHQVLALDSDESLILWLKSQTLDEIECVSYTPWPDEAQALKEAELDLAELPLAAFIHGAMSSPCNLRVGQYKDKSKKQSVAWRPWLKVASLAGISLVIYLTSLGLKIGELESQELGLKDDIVATYKIAFPHVKRLTDPKAQMKQELKKIGGGHGIENSLLGFLHDLRPAYQKAKGLKVQSMRFDSKRGEFRLTATAPSFQQFEQLKAAIHSDYKAEFGALNQTSDEVSGTITIRRAS